MQLEMFGVIASIFAAVYVLATVVYLSFRRYMQLKEKELKLQHARLDDFRGHLERQLMDLNAKFASSEGRWRELNHLVLAAQGESGILTRSKSKVAPTEFLRSHGIDVDRVQIRSDLVFVLTPFHDDLADEFNAIVQVGQELGFTVSRGDDKSEQGDIFPQILRLIVMARIVVANISGRNPNVFYELGVAHALGKHVILLAHRKADVPFDIQSKRIIFYRSSDELRGQLSKMLPRALVTTDT